MTQLYTYSTGWLKGKNGSTGDYKYTATIDLNSQNRANNTSNITVTLTLVGESNSGTLMWNAPNSESNRPYGRLSGDVSATGNRIVKYNKSTTPLTIVTWTGDIAHGTDGNKTLTVTFDWIAGALLFYPDTFTVATASVALPQIQRYGTLTVNDMLINNTTGYQTLKVRSDYGTFTYRVRMTIDGTTTTLLTQQIAQNQQIIPTILNTTLLDAIPSSKTKQITFTLQVNTGSWTTIQTETITATIDTNLIKPTVTITGVTIKNTPIAGVIVAGYTTLTVAYTTTNSRGSTGLNNTFTMSGVTFSPATSTVVGNGTTDTSAMPADGHTSDKVIYITATDSRGAKTTVSYTVSVTGYTAPIINAQAYRCDSNGNRDDTNAYVKCTWMAIYSLILVGNSGSETATLNGSAYTKDAVIALSEDLKGTFIITATDNCTTVTKKVTVQPATVPLDLYDDGSQNYGMATCGPIAEAGKIKLGNGTITELDMIGTFYKFLTTGFRGFINGNSTDADNLIPSTSGTIQAGDIGFYFTTSSTGRSNWPTNTQRGFLLSIAMTDNGTYAVQFAYMNTQAYLYQRIKNNGTWGAWRKVTFT